MRIVVTGGGTGGHIYPAFSIIKRMKERHPSAEVLYIGTERGLERELAPKSGVPCAFLRVEGLQRRVSARAFKTMFLAGTSFFSARRILKRFRPDVVIGTGGYVVLPVLLAARTLGVPSAVLELDAFAGLSNRLSGRFVNTVLLGMEAGKAFFQKAPRVVVTGNPRATEVLAVCEDEIARVCRTLGLDRSRPIVTILGGSRGARPINDAVFELLEKPRAHREQIVWITGQVHYEAICQRRSTMPVQKDVFILPYMDEMPALLSATTVLISRAGATILAELTALGVPAILIPSPYVTHHHQDYNAQALEAQGAAVVLSEASLAQGMLATQLSALLANPIRLEGMHKASQRMGKPDALTRIADEIERLLA
ncbi:undecaprenyldiphospho-muramoylpentapeptide beta-N-acetylglucosaminyltransferase [Ferroacidibacillus organovorans]|uniref:UDP-N-acetylglucosamine--N-acetylmuramyl-(pentapeptide) pyrophosphoryl-undecaprenol N-acetylglucosamine transferase n=1 Tax=Ferroacidibacillus organovorans TaxID=1765683 RepID=A0A853KDC5_9BACL|nr:undecaprenyldiphospho-muramoylpentapeptide beta-N-acetylglucosaminyltransferase [Ferroacidibacillus organovorans]OAG94189.1 hypothetical protein AYW79_06680 [Ferroacidibacillus organovorans]